MKTEIDEDEGISVAGNSMCPVCQAAVPGDTESIEAHIDACLRHAAEIEDSLIADGLEEYETGGATRIRIARSVDFRGWLGYKFFPLLSNYNVVGSIN